jgi:hypothetical protein
LGDVSRELVVDPPEEAVTEPTREIDESSEDIISESPEADADLITALDLMGCLSGETLEGILILAETGKPEPEL